MDRKKEMCVDNCCHPEQSIMGGVKYTKRLYKKYDNAKNPELFAKDIQWLTTFTNKEI